jgi:hypothetical protein
VQWINDREAKQPVGVWADELGKMLIGLAQGCRIAKVVGCVEEGRQQHGDIYAGFIQGRENLAGTFIARAMKVRVYDHTTRSSFSFLKDPFYTLYVDIFTTEVSVFPQLR